jgi:signal transduction histidine kinase
MPVKIKIGRLWVDAVSVAAVAAVWIVLAAVYFERVPEGLGSVEYWVMPWKYLLGAPIGTPYSERMAYLEALLEQAVVVGNLGLGLMVLSFGALVLYSTAVFQQKRRRARENELLHIKNREIARRNEFIRYISATIGHEFKNNLGRIKRRLALMDLPEEARAQTDSNLARLFADIDIFKRISDEREAGLVSFERIDLRALLSEVAMDYADMAMTNFEDSHSAPSIYASRTLLRTVFENIFDNAVKYRKPDQAVAFVSVSCAFDADGARRYVTLSVRDAGVGMDEQSVATCFYKGMGSGEGWGEGLYFAKYVIGLHAGKIRVGTEYTAPGRGTEIIVNLPYVEEAIDV